MEQLKMPMRDIRRQFTKSEMAIMGWRSSELAYNLELSTAQQAIPQEDGSPGLDLYSLEKTLEPISDRMTDSEGELDLRKLTGEEVMQYFSALGVGARN